MIKNLKTILIVQSFILIFLSSCSVNKNYLPEKFDNLKLIKKLSGDNAKDFVNRLHFGKVASSKNEIGFYEGDNKNAVIYITFYNSDQTAQIEWKKMTDKISPHNSVFYGFNNIEINGLDIFSCFGMGQRHFVFYKDKVLFWISTGTVWGEKFVGKYIDYIK